LKFIVVENIFDVLKFGVECDVRVGGIKGGL